MNACRISIIIPFYNVEKYIGQCLQSVTAQDFSDYEVICINDGSTDGSRDIVKAYAEKFTYIKIIDQPHSGPGNARNNGIRSARGEYIQFVDADDYIETNVLGALYTACSRSDLDILDFMVSISGDIKRPMYPEQSVTTSVCNGEKYLTDYITINGRQPFISVWAHLYRTEFLKKNDLFFIEGRLYEDIIYTLNAYYLAKTVMYFHMPVYYYRRVENSITTGATNREKILDLQFMANEVIGFSKHSGMKIPMDNFFSGIRNQTGEVYSDSKLKGCRKLFNRRIFRDLDFYLTKTGNRRILSVAKKSYLFFVLYCVLHYKLKGR